MDMNPYAPPELENSAPDLQANDQRIQLTRWECFLRTLPFSVAGGLLSGVVWGSGVMTFRLSASQAYSLIGGLLGLSVLSSLFTVGAFRGLTFRGQFVRSVVVLSGSCLAVLMIPLLSFCIRATGWHLVGTRTPWLWAISMYLPVDACAALICVTLRVAGVLAWRWTVRIFAFALLIAVVCNGSIDPFMLPNNSAEAHYRQRLLMLTLWFISTVGVIVWGYVNTRKEEDTAEAVARTA